MTAYQGRRVFRTAPYVIVAVLIATVMFASGTWYHFRTQGLSVRTLLFVVLGESKPV